MNRSRSRLSAALLLTISLPLAGCATIAGTAVSPITGGVDLCVESKCPWYTTPFVFLGGAVAGPFVALYNGINYDPSVFVGFTPYWVGFDRVFRPFDMISRR